jgi:hypothetical protein
VKGAAAETGLIFEWPEREGFPFILFGCVFFSLLAHVGTFFVFQVIYPQRATIPPPPPQVSLLTPSSAENESVLRWIATEDPALVASARSVVPPGLLEVPYRPSFSRVTAAPLGSVEVPAPLQFPPARTALAIIGSTAPLPPPRVPQPVAMRTTLTLAAPLADRPVKPPSFRWQQLARQPLQPLRALLGVAASGAVRFAFLQRSSGDEGIDAEALTQLERLEFASGAAEVTWALATLEFGAEAYPGAPSELRQRPRK